VSATKQAAAALTCRSDVEVFTPFPVDSISRSTHKTYLDTTGRPAITLKKARCTENHAQTVYVSAPPWYKLPRQD
jgi:hypothetical protein